VPKFKEELLPKKKFTFSKNKKKTTATTNIDHSNINGNLSISSNVGVDIVGKTVKDISGQILVYSQNEYVTNALYEGLTMQLQRLYVYEY